jgi:hypothetical protein
MKNELYDTFEKLMKERDAIIGSLKKELTQFRNQEFMSKIIAPPLPQSSGPASVQNPSFRNHQYNPIWHNKGENDEGEVATKLDRVGR